MTLSWFPIVKWEGGSERVTSTENLSHAFLNFSLIITEDVTYILRGAGISIWTPDCPKRALDICWRVEKEGADHLKYLLSCKQGIENWARGHRQPINKAYFRSFWGVSLQFQRLFQVPSGVILEAPKDLLTEVREERGHPYSLENDSAKPTMSIF